MGAISAEIESNARVREQVLLVLMCLIFFECSCNEEPAKRTARSPQMVTVPGGAIRTDCPSTAPDGCAANTVDVGPFEVDRTEVTVAQYRECVEADVCSSERLGSLESGIPAAEYPSRCNWGRAGFDDHPINCLAWRQARTYCEWVGKRLPTLAEWQLAAYGTDGRAYPWGDQGIVGQQAVANIAFDAGYDDGYAGTAPVGSFPLGASPIGAHDMLGNVTEWLADVPEVDYALMAGGSWWIAVADAEDVRNRLHRPIPQGFRGSGVGFRCVR